MRLGCSQDATKPVFLIILWRFSTRNGTVMSVLRDSVAHARALEYKFMRKQSTVADDQVITRSASRISGRIRSATAMDLRSVG